MSQDYDEFEFEYTKVSRLWAKVLRAAHKIR